MASPTSKKPLTTMDKTGAYFQKTVGVLHRPSRDEELAAVKYTAKHAHDKGDFVDLAEALGLEQVVNELVGEEWPDAG